MKYRIQIPKSNRIGAHVPGHIFRQRPFSWEPSPFEVHDERFDIDLVDEDVQLQMYDTFRENGATRGAGIYCISGNPDDSMSKYFGAYLANYHLEHKAHGRVAWVTMYGGFSNPLVDNEVDGAISLLIVSNLTPNATGIKLDKTRDLLEYYSHIPRLVIVAGTDPFSFLAGKLYLPVNGCIYIQSNAIAGHTI